MAAGRPGLASQVDQMFAGQCRTGGSGACRSEVDYGIRECVLELIVWHTHKGKCTAWSAFIVDGRVRAARAV